MNERARPKRHRATHRAIIVATLLYVAAAAAFPLYLSEQTCRPGLTHASPFLALARNWLACHMPEEHLDVGAYGAWLAGTLLIPLIFWAYRAFTAQEMAAEEQRRAIFLATIPRQHERFEALASRIATALTGERGQGDPVPDGIDHDGRPTYAIPTVNTMITRRLRTGTVELKATLRRTPWAEEYVAEGHAFLAALRRFDLPAYSGGPWRDLLATLEKF